jgi:hypothetical protein
MLSLARCKSYRGNSERKQGKYGAHGIDPICDTAVK